MKHLQNRSSNSYWTWCCRHHRVEPWRPPARPCPCNHQLPRRGTLYPVVITYMHILITLFSSAETLIGKENSGCRRSKWPCPSVPRWWRPPWHWRVQGLGTGSLWSFCKSALLDYSDSLTEEHVNIQCVLPSVGCLLHTLLDCEWQNAPCCLSSVRSAGRWCSPSQRTARPAWGTRCGCSRTSSRSPWRSAAARRWRRSPGATSPPRATGTGSIALCCSLKLPGPLNAMDHGV